MRQRRLSSRAVSWLLLLAALAVTVISSFNQLTYAADQERINECYRSSFDAFVVAVDRLGEAAKGERRAQRDLLGASLAPQTPEQRQATYERYITVLDRADEIRESTTMVPEGGCR